MGDNQQLTAMSEYMPEVKECKAEFKVPDGWKLVPLEPTGEMVDASVEEWHTNEGFLDDMNKMMYKAMLAVAPEYKP